MTPRSTLLTSLFCIAGILSDFTSAYATEKDERIFAAATQEVPGAVDTIRNLASIDSGSGNAAGLAEIADTLDNRLRALGFETRRHTSDFDVGADTVVGTKSGKGAQKVLLMAHMDTVFGPGIQATMPIRQDADRLYGPGVVDAKGGIAVILHTLKMLQNLDWSDYDTLTVLFNPDEETGSAGSGALITDLASRADTVLSFEVGGDSTRGMAWTLAGTAAYASVRMEVTGKAAHAGSAPEDGRNAALELAHQMLQTRDLAGEIKGAQMNWTKVITENAYNQIPDRAVALADARITTEGAEKELLAALQAKVAESKLIRETSVDVSVEILRPGFKAGAESYSVGAIAHDVYKEVSPLNFYTVPMVKGATDAGYAAISGNAAVLEGFGPSGWNLHSSDEYVELDSLLPAMYQVSRLLIELGRRKPE